MCYDKAYLTKRQERYTQWYGTNPAEVEYLKEQLTILNLGPVYHASGFDHPLVPVITTAESRIEAYSWGLIPYWVKSPAEAVTISNSTINARVESMFEKPAFREPARNKRCLVIVDGFFEHHHKSNKTFPHYIRLKNDEPMLLAGLWDEWTDKNSAITRHTYAIVTTKANPLMARIHNNPKLEAGPRMPLILPKELAKSWLMPINEKIDQELIESIIHPNDENELEAFPVRKLRRKEAVGNIPDALQPHRYQELEDNQGYLF